MSQTQETSEAESLFRKILLGKPLLICVAAIIIYTLAGFFLTPYLVKRQLTAYVSETLGRQMSVEQLRLNPYALTLDVSGLTLKEPDGSPILSFDRLFVNFELKSLFRWAWTFAEISLDRPIINIDIRPDNVVNLARLMKDATLQNAKAESAPQAEQDRQLPRLYFERIRITKGQLMFADRSDPTPAKATFEPINLQIMDLTTIPERKGPHTIMVTLPQGGNLKWKGEISLDPMGSEGEFALQNFKLATAWRFLQDELNLEKPQGDVEFKARYRFSYAEKTPQLVIDRIGVLISALSLKLRGSQDPTLVLEKISLSDGKFDLACRELNVGHLDLARGKVAAGVGKDGRFNWERLINTEPVPKKESEKAFEEEERPFRLLLSSVTVDDIAINYLDQSRIDPLGIELGRFNLKFSAELEKKTKTLEARANNISLNVSDLSAQQTGKDDKLVSIKHISARGGEIDVAGRKATIGEIALSDGQIEAWRDPEGTINWIRLATKGNEGAIAKEIKETRAKNISEGKPWSVLLPSIQVDRFGLRLSDRMLHSPEVYNLKNIHLHVKDFSNKPDSPFKFDLGLEVAQGGTALVKGTVNAFQPSARLNININSLGLPPLQPYLNRVTKLSLDSGHVSVRGDVNYGTAGEDTVTFAGDVGLNELLLTLPQTKQPFLSWKSLDVRGINFTTTPKGVKVHGVQITDPYCKLVIKKDHTTNMGEVLVTDEEGEKAEAGSGGAEAEGGEDKAGGGGFPFEIKRIRFQNGKLDFADQSLVLKFGANIRKLNGAIVGLSSRPESRASMELEGRVGKYGSAEIKGELQPFNVKSYSDVMMIFRNVAMTDLTPYSANFAGRKIDSGKLSLDLNYKINKSHLKGENKIIMDSFVLGERVEGPNAVDLPLDLAIALLKDTNDRIDIGLPVEGNLENPEFSYGHLIWKALFNLITKIATAPFRALAGILGTDEENLDSIAFEAGDADLPPPEAEKLASLAKAFQQRPQLSLEVRGQYHPEVDAPVLKALAVKRKLAMQMGFAVKPNQDPGPVSFTDSATQQALDSIAKQGLTSETLRSLRKKFGIPLPKQKSITPPATKPATKKAIKSKPAKTPPPPDPEGFYAEVFEQLVHKEPIDEGVLKALAQGRATAIIQELTKEGGVDTARVSAVEPVQAEQGQGELVLSKLSIAVRK